jgi:hypothetical protein
VGLGAIVAIGVKDDVLSQKTASSTGLAGTAQETLIDEPLARVEIVGRSTAERVIERFLANKGKGGTAWFESFW